MQRFSIVNNNGSLVFANHAQNLWDTPKGAGEMLYNIYETNTVPKIVQCFGEGLCIAEFECHDNGEWNHTPPRIVDFGNANTKFHPVFFYLIECINDEFYGSTKSRLKQVCEAFNSEYNDPYSKNRYPYLQDRFAEWLMGLPTAINVEYRHHSILELAIKWGTLPKNASEAKQDKIIENWFNFAACKFFRLCKFYKVDTAYLKTNNPTIATAGNQFVNNIYDYKILTK